jgi:hypothetical protein
MDDKLVLTWASEFDWEFGLSSPVQWADFESWHEVATWKEQLFTESCVASEFSVILLDSDFNTLFGISIAPTLEIGHLNIFENIFYYWPGHGHHDEDMADDAHGGLLGDFCNYQGWQMELFMIKVDFALALRSCENEVFDVVEDFSSFGCEAEWGEIEELFEFEIKPFGRHNVNGMYDMGWNINTCDKYKDRIDGRALEVRSLKEALKEVHEEEGDAEVRLNNIEYW